MSEKRNSTSKRREVALNLEKCLSSEKNDGFVKMTHEMLHSPVYMSLDIYSKELFRYMIDWATHSKLFWDTGKFEYSASLAVKIGLVGERKVFYCFKELREKGFIDREISKSPGLPSLWSFSKRWQVDSVEKVKSQDIKLDNTDYRTIKKKKTKK